MPRIGPTPTTPPQATTPPRRYRLVFLLPTLDIGGAERVVLRTARGLDTSRFEPIVLGMARGSGRLEAELQAAGIPVDHLGSSTWFAPLMGWRLWSWLRRHPCDVLMTFMFHANVVGRFVRVLGGVPALVCSERAVWREPGPRLAINWLTASFADVITTNSREGVRVWAQRLGRSEESIRLIYNGVDVERFPVHAPVARPDVVIGNLARLHPLKGQDALFDALARLAARTDLPPWHCRVAGDGPDLARLEQRRAELGLADRVTFVGHVEAPERFLPDLDVFANTSSTEGMPNAVLEAMACGLPVVATDVGGTREVVDDGVTGWLVPADDPAALCERLAGLVRDAGARAAMGQAGRVRVERLFSVTRMVGENERLLNEVIAARLKPQNLAATH